MQNDPAPVTFGSGTGQATAPVASGSDAGQASDQRGGAGGKNENENDRRGAVLGDSVSNSSNSSNSSRSSSTYNPTTPSIPSTLNPVPSPLNFSALGISEYQLNSIIAQQLTNLASIGLLGFGQGSSSWSSPPSAPYSCTISPAPAPIDFSRLFWS